MRLKLSTVIIIFAFCWSPVRGQTEASCHDDFQDFQPLILATTPTARNEIYPRQVITWYENCILVGSARGLWLVDPTQPENAIQLAELDGRTIYLAVDSRSRTIALSIAQESDVYIIQPDSPVDVLKTSGEAITAIDFSSNGELMMVASSNIESDFGLYLDARVQVWNRLYEPIATIFSDVSYVSEMWVTEDENYLLSHGIDEGVGHQIEYWDIATETLVWNYGDLLRDLDPWTVNDPLLFYSVASRNNIVAFGGLYGYFDWDEYYGTAVHIWDLPSRTRIQEIILFGHGSADEELSLSAIALNADATQLVTAFSDGRVLLWNVDDGLMVNEYNTSFDSIYQVIFNDDGSMLSISGDEEIVLIDSESFDEIARLQLSQLLVGN